MEEHTAMSKRILIVSFDTPYPTNYGGVYDVMAKIRFFKEHDYIVDLISVSLDTERVRIFENYVSKGDIFGNHKNLNARITFKKMFSCLFSLNPISMTLRNESLDGCSFIRENRYEFVLIEHAKMSCYAQQLSKLTDAPIYLRLHNDECQYYKALAQKTSSIIKKFFLLNEAARYYRIQKKLLYNEVISRFLLISENDLSIFDDCSSHVNRLSVLPIYVDEIFPRQNTYVSDSKIYDFIYVGNLELDDNFDAVILALNFISENGFSEAKILVAGKCVSESRQIEIKNAANEIIQGCDFRYNVSPDELIDIYSSGKVFLNFSTNSGGVKTKLMEALQFQISVLSNHEGVENSGLEDLVILAESNNILLLNSIISDPEFREKRTNEVAEKFRSYASHVNDIYRKTFVEPFL